MASEVGESQNCGILVTTEESHWEQLLSAAAKSSKMRPKN